MGTYGLYHAAQTNPAAQWQRFSTKRQTSCLTQLRHAWLYYESIHMKDIRDGVWCLKKLLVAMHHSL